MKGQKTLFSSASEEWSTPQDLFDQMNQCFSFTVDSAAGADNFKCPMYWDKKVDGLEQDWSGHRVWCNPPYGRNIGEWVAKAARQQPGISVLLLPARVDTKWYQDYIKNKNRVYVEFCRGRLKFGGSKNSAPFPSMIVTFLNY